MYLKHRYPFVVNYSLRRLFTLKIDDWSDGLTFFLKCTWIWMLRQTKQCCFRQVQLQVL